MWALQLQAAASLWTHRGGARNRAEATHRDSLMRWEERDEPDADGSPAPGANRSQAPGANRSPFTGAFQRRGSWRMGKMPWEQNVVLEPREGDWYPGRQDLDAAWRHLAHNCFGHQSWPGAETHGGDQSCSPTPGAAHRHRDPATHGIHRGIESAARMLQSAILFVKRRPKKAFHQTSGAFRGTSPNVLKAVMLFCYISFTTF